MSAALAHLKFSSVFAVYVAYVLFRRLPIVLLPQIREEVQVSNDDIGYNPEPINGQLQLTSTEYSEAGLASGVVTRVIIQPLDVLKIRFQLQEEPIRGKTSGKYKGVLQSILLITREEGAAAFWKGHLPAQGLSAMYGLVQFSSFEWLSRKVGSLVPSTDAAVRSSADFACGALSGCLAMTAAMPLDVIRTRLVAQSGKTVYTGTSHAIRHIWKKEGVSGYFRGWVPSVAQIAPFTGMQFALYNSFMELWPIEGHDSSAALFSGAMAGTVSKTILYPLDMVRHRLQMNGFERKGFGKSSNYSHGMIHTVLMVVKNEGWYGLFKGLWPSQIKAAANSGCAFLFYEYFCEIIRARVLVSGHAALFTVSKLFFGVAADRTSNVRIFLYGVIVCALASICLAFTTQVSHMVIVMLLIGSVQGAGWVPATKLVEKWYSKSAYATMFSLLGCGSTTAGLLLPVLKPFYWRTIEFNTAISMLIFSAFCFYLLRNDHTSPRDDKNKCDSNKKRAEVGLLDIAKSTPIWHIAIVYLFSMEMRTICETWIPLFLAERNMQTEMFQLLLEVGGFCGTVASGLSTDVLARRIGVDMSRRLIGFFCTAAMLISAVGVIQMPAWNAYLGFMMGFFVNGSINLWCLMGSQAGDSHVAGACSAFISFIACSGSIFAGSPLASLIGSFGYDVLVPLLFAQTVIVLSIALFRIPLKMAGTESKVKSE